MTPPTDQPSDQIEQPAKDLRAELLGHIHMLGCQALTEARNLGYAEGKGEKEDDGDLLDMTEKHEKLLLEAVADYLTSEMPKELPQMPIGKTTDGYQLGWNHALSATHEIIDGLRSGDVD